MFQIEEGDVFYVAGGLLVEHPLTSPLVEAIVSYTYSDSWLHTELHMVISKGIASHLTIGTLVQVGTIDSVMGLPKALTEKLIKESLSEQ